MPSTKRKANYPSYANIEKCPMLQTQIYRCIFWKLMEEVCAEDRRKVILRDWQPSKTRGISPTAIDASALRAAAAGPLALLLAPHIPPRVLFLAPASPAGLGAGSKMWSYLCASRKQFTSNLVFGKVVTVKVRHLDRYGRLVTRVVTDGKDVSHELLKAGLARHFKKYSSDPELAELEIKAGEAKVGIWSARNAPLSWEDANATSRRGQGRERGPVSRLRPQQGLTSGQLPVLRVPELHCRF